MTNPREQAQAAQRAASNPAVSAFVAASAGSGKTKLLTDRILRLLLGGADPGKILCLTFTKAAAAEMAIRLQQRLVGWFSAETGELIADLEKTGIPPTPANQQKARELFARVLDAPGGMRIGTIHAFSQSLLRRFPLEAAISPHFTVMEDQDAAETLHTALAETELDSEAAAIVASLLKLPDFAARVAAMRNDTGRLLEARALGPKLLPALRRLLGAEQTDTKLPPIPVSPPNETILHDAARNIIEKKAAKTFVARAEAILDWLNLPAGQRQTMWHAWRAQFIKKDGEPYQRTTLISKPVNDANPGYGDALAAEADRIHRYEAQLRIHETAEASAAFIALAAPVLSGYGDLKQSSSRLDYGDLIFRSVQLLRDPGAAWVLYKLDGGLDHILLDEVQDTAPDQWNIAHAITGDFFAQAPEDSRPRTVFAVGDRKQSIYSFQGADVAAFDLNRARLASRVQQSGAGWCEQDLLVSFRSTAPVLALVDAVFAGPAAAEGVGENLRHLADRQADAGSVELWPLMPRPEPPEPKDGQAAETNQYRPNVQRLVAEALAGWIAATLKTTLLESQGRPVQPGDIMILLRQRGTFAAALVRALKARNVPVAGLDRMVLTAQPAVQDLLAFCDAILLPEDDLTLATVLRSPLGGLTEDDLYALAAHRRSTLWQSLRARAHESPRWRHAHDRIARLMARVDHAAPFALLSELLFQHGGRASLLRRLGPEASEPIDEFLAAAQRYQLSHPPSMQGFLHWVRRSAAEIKREPGGSGAVRIMTVHGAKGLQAPIVILPDTTGVGGKPDSFLWMRDAESGTEIPVFPPKAELRCEAITDALAAKKQKGLGEYNRLLYVALTRAEDRLIVCGWQPHQEIKREAWYESIKHGFGALPTEEAEIPCWPGKAKVYRTPQIRALAPPEAAAEAELAPLPAWAGAAPDWRAEPAKVERESITRLVPSQTGEEPAAAPPWEEADPAGKRFLRGKRLHALLQHLPLYPQAERAARAQAWAARNGFGDSLAAEALAVIAHPELAPLFGPGSRAEVPLTGIVNRQIVSGLVDRLAVTAESVMIADYKTNRDPPASLAATPARYLRQMAAYRALLAAIYPGKQVVCALIWTRTAAVQILPRDWLALHSPAASPAP